VGARITGEAAVRAATELPADRLVNIFRIAGGDMERRIEALPAVLDAQVRATLPDRVEIAVTERTPMLTWRVGTDAWLADGKGFLFAAASALDGGALGSGATGSRLPAVDDRRSGETLGLGGTLGSLDLEVVRLLLTITPAMIRSDAPELFLSVNDTEGYVLEAPDRWRAVFGPYTPVLRPPSIIPAQVQCLDALLAAREAEVGLVKLSLSDDACGTFQPRVTPRPTPRGNRPEATPGGRRPGPAATPRPNATRRP
jgi:hypothetical protein